NLLGLGQYIDAVIPAQNCCASSVRIASIISSYLGNSHGISVSKSLGPTDIQIDLPLLPQVFGSLQNHLRQPIPDLRPKLGALHIAFETEFGLFKLQIGLSVGNSRYVYEMPPKADETAARIWNVVHYSVELHSRFIGFIIYGVIESKPVIPTPIKQRFRLIRFCELPEVLKSGQIGDR